MNRVQIKKCAVQGCTTIDSAGNKKHFFAPPRDLTTRGLWMFAAGKVYASSTKFLICEDHFDVSLTINHEQGK